MLQMTIYVHDVMVGVTDLSKLELTMIRIYLPRLAWASASDPGIGILIRVWLHRSDLRYTRTPRVW
jgi:hypothetical protein